MAIENETTANTKVAVYFPTAVYDAYLAGNAESWGDELMVVSEYEIGQWDGFYGTSDFDALKLLRQNHPGLLWYGSSKPTVRKIVSDESITAGCHDYDVVLFYTMEKSIVPDNYDFVFDSSICDLLSQRVDKGDKFIARAMNIAEIKLPAGRLEWTYKLVRQIFDRAHSTDTMLLRDHVVDQIIAYVEETHEDFTSPKFIKWLHSNFRVGYSFTRTQRVHASFFDITVSYEVFEEEVTGADLACALLYDPKHNVDDDCAVVTASDGGFFVSLQLLTLSLLLSHNVRYYVVDLGMTSEQLAWLETQGAIIIPSNDIPLIWGRNEFMWQTWNKPLWIAAAPSKYTLWIDCDCMVTRNLVPLFEILKVQPVATLETVSQIYAADQWRETVSNKPELYKLAPTPERFWHNFPNAGVIGLSLSRDRDRAIYDAYTGLIKRTVTDPDIRENVKWWDQGAWFWALESTANTSILIEDPRWNDAASVNGHMSLKSLLSKIPHTTSSILHFAGHIKPWRTYKRW